jgi:hypothetical protein
MRGIVNVTLESKRTIRNQEFYIGYDYNVNKI